MKKALLILAHGSRVEDTREVVYNVVEKIKSLNKYSDVKAGFMEFNEPDIHNSIKEFVEMGIYDIIAVPMFLYDGNHVLKDIPEIFKREMEMYPQLNIKFGKSIGYDDRIADIILERAEAVV